MSGERPEPQQASEVHLLVHPGFVQERKEILLLRYAAFSRILSSRALLINLLYLNEHFSLDVAPSVIAACCMNMKSHLRDRMVTLLGYFAVVDSDPELHGPVLNRAKVLAEEQGWTFSPETPSYAWGETSGSCVPNTAQNANVFWGLEHPTMILPHMTDRGGDDEGMRWYYDRKIAGLRERFSRIEFPQRETTWMLEAQVRHLMSQRRF